MTTTFTSAGAGVRAAMRPRAASAVAGARCHQSAAPAPRIVSAARKAAGRHRPDPGTGGRAGSAAASPAAARRARLLRDIHGTLADRGAGGQTVGRFRAVDCAREGPGFREFGFSGLNVLEPEALGTTPT